MKTYSAADIAATTPEQLARLREAGPLEDYAAWIRAAAELGLVEAQAIHGQMLLDGAGVERDQAEDYARRKDWPLAEAERWLAPILNYEPRTRDAAA